MKKQLSFLAVLLFCLPLIAQVDCLEGDCFNGRGMCIFPSGAKYDGEFLQGKIHGQGTLFFSNGNKYTGTWVNQYREGRGLLTFEGGDEYKGEFLRNAFHGRGTMTYANGNKYVGQWRENQPNGQGTFYYANGDRYEGNFKDGQCAGTGTLFYNNDARYTGQWARNQPHGEGALYLPGGEAIAGVWKSGQYQADWSRLAFSGDTTYLKDCNRVPCATLGKYRYPDGTIYTGEFSHGRAQGKAKVYYQNGDRYEGLWAGDAPSGRGVMYYATGKILGAYWERGQPTYEMFSRYEAERNGDVASGPASTNEVKIWAVVIGAAHYTHMPTLRYTDDDAYQIYAFLKSPEGGALPDNQLRLLVDEDATQRNIMEAMRNTFSQADENDVLLFYFSGHGLQGAFLPTDYDGNNNRLEHESIKELLTRSRAKHKLVLADACHSGSYMEYKSGLNIVLDKFYKAFEETAGGTALLMSSKGEEYSLEDGGLRSGIFSHFLVRGLKGAADKDSNRIVTIGELFDYVHQKVRMYTGNVQTPTLTGQFDRRMPVSVVR